MAIIGRFKNQNSMQTMKLLFLLAAFPVLLAACATGPETVAQQPAMKCDRVEPTTGSRITRKENCVPDPEATRKQ